MAPLQVLMNFKFFLFFKSFTTINSYHSNANLNSLDAIDLIVFIFMSSVSQRGNEKICEEIVACLFGDPTKPIANEPKKKNLKNQSGKLIWFTKIDGLQGLLGLNLFVKKWQDE
jgi:hypothetical protein